jgi:hypothetical protein
VGFARLIIKPQTSALADEIKTAVVTLRPTNGTVRTEQFILACEVCTRVLFNKLHFSTPFPLEKYICTRVHRFKKRMPEGCYEISSMV